MGRRDEIRRETFARREALHRTGCRLDAVHAATRAGVDAAPRVLSHTPDVERQGFGRPHRLERRPIHGRTIDAAQASFRGADPQAAVFGEVQRRDISGRQALLGGERLKSPVAESRHAALVEADPDVVAVLRERARAVEGFSERRQAVGLRIRAPRIGRAIPAHDRARRRRHPEIARGIFEDARDVVIRQAVAAREHRGTLVCEPREMRGPGESIQPCRGHHPPVAGTREISVGGAPHARRVRRQRWPNRREPAILEPIHAMIARDGKHVAGVVFGEPVDRSRAKAVCRAVGDEAVASHFREAGLRTHPEVASAIDHHRVDAIVGQAIRPGVGAEGAVAVAR